jgi:dipeptidyl aminopeptidase/acylaminoacyl peptidase
MMIRALLFLLLAAAAAPAFAQAPATGSAQTAPAPGAARRPLEQFGRLPFIMGPRLSPDGTRIAALVVKDGRQVLAIYRLTAPEAERISLVSLDEVDLNWWEWVNEDYLIAGVGGPDKALGFDFYLRRTVSISADGKKVKPIVPDRAAQQADDVIWIANDGTPRILLAMQTSLYDDVPGFWPSVYEIDVATGRNRRVVAPHDNVSSWYADSNGIVRIGVGYKDADRTSFLLYRAPGESMFRIVDRGSRRADDDLLVPALFTADPGKAIAFSDKSGFDALYELDLKAMTLGASVFGVDGYDIGAFVSDRARNSVLGISYTDTRSRMKWLDPDLAEVQSQIDAAVGERRADIVSMSRDRRRLLVLVGGPDRAGAYFYYDRAAGKMQKFADVNTDFGGRRLAPVSTVRYQARDGLDISAILTMPAGRDPKNLPLILMPHGGPFARDSEEWDWWTQFLADRGYAVLQPNYRGSSGFGTAFAEKGEGQWGLAMQDDLDDAVAWAVKSGLADPRRVCIVGASYGGYAALRAAQRGGETYRCAVSYAGVSDLGAILRYDRRFLNSGSRRDWLREQAPDFRAVSPINHAAEFAIPTLIMHGKKDRTVPVAQSREMAEKLGRAGKAFTYIEQPEGDHSFSREADRIQFLRELESFLAKHNPA